MHIFKNKFNLFNLYLHIEFTKIIICKFILSITFIFELKYILELLYFLLYFGHEIMSKNMIYADVIITY